MLRAKLPKNSLPLIIQGFSKHGTSISFHRSSISSVRPHGGLISILFYKKNVTAVSTCSSSAVLKCDTPFSVISHDILLLTVILKLVAASQLFPDMMCPWNGKYIPHIYYLLRYYGVDLKLMYHIGCYICFSSPVYLRFDVHIGMSEVCHRILVGLFIYRTSIYIRLD